MGAVGTSDTTIATTAFVGSAVSAISTTYVAVAGDTMTGALNMSAAILPTADNLYEIGSTSLRFANIYSVNTHAGDLHLTNERGSYTLIEEEDALTIRNNKTGKVYNILMEERV